MVEFVVSFVLEKIAMQLIEESVSLSRVHNEIEWISGELRRMQCFLKDAETKQEGDERVKNWIADVRDLAYDTDDLIDTFVLETARQRKNGLIELVKRYALISNEIRARCKFKMEIKEIKKKVNAISDSRSTYGIENIGGGGKGKSIVSNRLKERRKSSPHTCEEDVIGLEQDITMLVEQLVWGESRRSIISIVGMGGLGKTTLAKQIYHSSDVRKHFDCCSWVYVSQEYRVNEILQDLGKQLLGLGKAESEKMSKEDLEEELSVCLQGKRYLIVMDDLWRKEAWDDLKGTFLDNRNGSRILITTRDNSVALHADPLSRPHELHFLNDEESWELLSRKVIPDLDSMTGLPPGLEELGKQIVKKCGGLPLAVVILGGILSTKDRTFSEWLKVVRSIHWQLNQGPVECSGILALSYNDLPYHMKPCFLYFGLFPEDFEISARRLILLWVAEGFVQQRGDEPLEDVAEDYLEELIERSMVQVATRKSNGRVKTCRMHDLLRDLSTSKAKEDKFLDVIHGGTNSRSLTKARRLGVHSGTVPVTKNSSCYRSLLCFDLGEPLLKEIKKFKLLRVLDLEGIHIQELDSAIGNLVHLRYLGLRGTWLKRLPPSICNLWNLQTVDIRSTLLDPIPTGIWSMQQLRHLYLNELREMVLHPPTDSSLDNLQTLHGICINEASWVENGLCRMTKLRDLAIHGDLLSQAEALAKWIVKLDCLECLKLHAADRLEDRIRTAIPNFKPFSNHLYLYKLHLSGWLRKLPDQHEFPPNLTELSLEETFLMENPMSTLEKLPSLRVLRLKRSSYVGMEMECSSGGFPQLQFLKLSFVSALRTLRIEEGAMKNLRLLEIIECKQLRISSEGLRPLINLRELKLGCLPQEFEAKLQQLERDNWYKIQHVYPM